MATRFRNPDPLMLTDIEDKLFKESGYIETIMRIVTSEIEPPYAISIDGDWGAGKTTIMKLLQKKLKEESEPFPTFWFNPWEHKGSKDVALSFLQNLANCFPKEIGARGAKVGRFFQLLAVAGIDFISRVISNGNLSLDVVSGNAEKIEKELPKWKTFHSISDEIRNEFVKLVNMVSDHYKNKPLFIFVDDFDRCLPDDTIRLLEAIKNLFVAKATDGKTAKVIFICGINTDIAKYFISHHYNLGQEKSDYAFNYFRKIFNLTFSIPYSQTTRELVEQYFNNFELTQKMNQYNLIDLIINEGRSLNISSIRKYQNIVNNYAIILKFNEIKEMHIHRIILYMLILKEASNDMYYRVKQWAMEHSKESFGDLFNNRVHLQEKSDRQSIYERWFFKTIKEFRGFIVYSIITKYIL